jgi:hypothetical protein
MHRMFIVLFVFCQRVYFCLELCSPSSGGDIETLVSLAHLDPTK